MSLKRAQHIRPGRAERASCDYQSGQSLGHVVPVMWPVSRVSSLIWNVLWLEAALIMVWWYDGCDSPASKECSRNDGHVPAQGGAGQEEGRKEEQHKGGTDAATRHCPRGSVVSSSAASAWQMTQLCRAASADVREQVRSGQEWLWSSVSCHNSPTLLYIKHGALYPVERSLDYQFPFC